MKIQCPKCKSSFEKTVSLGHPVTCPDCSEEFQAASSEAHPEVGDKDKTSASSTPKPESVSNMKIPAAVLVEGPQDTKVEVLIPIPAGPAQSPSQTNTNNSLSEKSAGVLKGARSNELDQDPAKNPPRTAQEAPLSAALQRIEDETIEDSPKPRQAGSLYAETVVEEAPRAEDRSSSASKTPAREKESPAGEKAKKSASKDSDSKQAQGPARRLPKTDESEEPKDDKPSRLKRVQTHAPEKTRERTSLAKRRKSQSLMLGVISLAGVLVLLFVLVTTPFGKNLITSLGFTKKKAQVIRDFKDTHTVTAFDQEDDPSLSERMKDFETKYPEWKIVWPKRGTSPVNWNLRANGVIDNVISTTFTGIERFRETRGPCSIHFRAAILESRPGGTLSVDLLREGAAKEVSLAIRPPAVDETAGVVSYNDKRTNALREVPANIFGGIWYPIKVDVRENGVTMFIGGTRVIAYRLDPSEIARVGLSTRSARVLIKDLVLKEEIAIQTGEE